MAVSLTVSETKLPVLVDGVVEYQVTWLVTANVEIDSQVFLKLASKEKFVRIVNVADFTFPTTRSINTATHYRVNTISAKYISIDLANQAIALVEAAVAKLVVDYQAVLDSFNGTRLYTYP